MSPHKWGLALLAAQLLAANMARYGRPSTYDMNRAIEDAKRLIHVVEETPE